MKAIRKRVEQAPEVLEVENITTELIKDAIGGGWMEVCNFYFPDPQTKDPVNIIIYGDEEAKLKELPPNFPISLGPPLMGDVIRGGVLFVGPPDMEGNEQGVTPEQERAILSYFDRLRQDWERFVPREWYEPRSFIMPLTDKEFEEYLGV